MTSHRRLPAGPRNVLTGVQKFSLWKLLAESEAELLAGQPTYEQAAITMSERLGFRVTAANVVDAVDNGIVAWKPANRGPSVSGRKLAQELADLAARVSALEDVVLRLCCHAGIGVGVDSNGLALKPRSVETTP